MNERDYLRLKRQAEEECRKKLEALELVWEMAKGNASKEHAPFAEMVERGDLREAILEAIRELTHDFTVEHILAKIRAIDPALGERAKASSVSSALKRMVGNDIEIVVKGVGRKPSLYRKKVTEIKVVGATG
jgi:hypothetical protein